MQVESVERDRTRPHVEFCLVDDSVDCSGAPPPPTLPLCDTELSHSIAASQQQQQQQQQQQRGLQRRDTPHHLKNKRVNTPPLPPAAGASAADSAAASVADTDPAQADRVRRLLARQIIGRLCTTAEEMTGAADSSPAAGLMIGVDNSPAARLMTGAADSSPAAGLMIGVDNSPAARLMTGAADSSPAAGLMIGVDNSPTAGLHDDTTEVCRPHPTAPRHFLPQMYRPIGRYWHGRF